MITEIRLESVGVRAGQTQVLAGIDLTIRAGSATAITGPSGSGKTTLLLVAGGLQMPSEGQVLADGLPLTRDAATRQRFGVVLQNHGLVSVLTALENVAVPLQARSLPPAEILERSLGALAAVGLHASADSLVRDLSGGQQQRVAVARALAAQPEVLLADEPTSELVAEQRKAILELLLEQARAGRVLLIATHDPEVVEACATAVRLVDGRLAEKSVS